MSQDRFVRFPASRPTVDEMRCLLEDFFASAAESIKWESDRFFVIIPGPCSDALRRLGRDRYASEPFDRALEVWFGRDGVISVITRHADDYVSALADRIAHVIVLRWQGLHGLQGDAPQ